MNTFELLAHVRRLGGQITVEEGKLRVNLPKGMLTPELKAQIAEQKAAILSILDAAGKQSRTDGPPPVRLSRSEKLPLSFAQQRLWFLHEFIDAPESYNVGQAFRLRGDLDIRALQSAFDELLTRHESLRAKFVSDEGTPFQIFTNEGLPRIRLEELEVRPGEAPLTAAERSATAELERPFDFDRDIPIRARLWHLTEGDHFLLVILHHIVADGWSVGVLRRDLAGLYSAAVRRVSADLPALPFQYADFAGWQRNWIQGAELDRLLGYWSNTLTGVPPLELPLDRTRPPKRSYSGRIDNLILDADLARALDELSQRAGATLFMTMLAAFNVLLQRYTRQEDVAVGSPIGNRGRPEFEDLIGCFLNMLVLRTDLTGDPTFLELVERVRAVTLGAFEHQSLPFERLVEELGVQRDLSVNPLFQVLFAVQNAPSQSLGFSGLQVDEVELERNYTNVDLDVHVLTVPNGLRVAFVYNTDIFEAETIHEMGRAFRVLLEEIVKRPDRKISSFALCEEAALIPFAQARGAALDSVSRPPCVHGLVAAQAARTPDAAAVDAADGHLTYAEMDRRVKRLADRLEALGVGADVLVGLCTERGVDMPVAMLAIQAAGGAYLPLDSSLPADRLRYMLEDSGAKVLLTQGSLTTLLPAFEGKIVLLEDGETQPETLTHEPRVSTGPEDLAYVIYTSGSTGKPKGVEVKHGSVVNFLRSMQVVPGMDARDVLVAVTTLSFDIAGLELLLPLTVGARVVIATKEVAADGHRLREMLDSAGATVMQATPATWQMLIHAGWEGDRRLRMLCGGEALPRQLANELLARGGELWNMYGPTETTIWSAVSRITAGDGPIDIGAPIANTQLLVLDAQLRPVPQGVPGELFIAGAGLARGYRNRPELTAEKFVKSPRPKEVEGRLYRTGDLVRYDARRRLRFLGRTDDQVKLRGFRIELGEIEAVLSQHPGVHQTAVVIADAPGEEPRLVAYWVARVGQDPSAADLRRFLHAQLPEYMVPNAIVKLESLPLSPAGKVDRKRLRAIQLPAPVVDPGRQGIDLPRSPTEDAVAAAFREVLRLERVGIRDDFFALGGHSLLATRLVSRIRNLFQVELALSQVFESATIEGLARCVETARKQPGQVRDESSAITLVPRDRSLPLSFAQNRLWLIEQMGGGAGNHIRMEIGLRGPLDRAALERSLDAIVARHETLRTRFESMGGSPRQVIDVARHLPLTWVDRSGVKPVDRPSVLKAIAAEDAAHPYDLERGPLFRAALVKFGDEEHVLCLSFHHIVADGWSFAVLKNEIAAHYRAQVSREPVDLPSLPVQYADFASWQRIWLSEESLQRQLTYWKRHLAGGVSTLQLPTDRPRPPVQSFDGAVRRLVMGRPLQDSLTALAREHHATMAMVCLAAFQTLLARYTGQGEIVVGSPIANRTRAEVEGLIGFFVNSLVMRADVSGNPRFSDFVRQVRDASLAAYDHQDLPFEQLVDEIDPSRDPSRTPLFQVVFAMHLTEEREIDSGGLRMALLAADASVTRFDLELHLFEGSGGLEAAFVYSTALFDAATMERMAIHYQTLLEGIVKTPQARLSELPMLGAGERKAALDDWNATRVEVAGSGCIHHLVEEQSRVRPKALAVVHHESTLTYAELNARANRMARVLRSMGVRRDMLVGLCVQRGLDMVVGMLAILKAGGAYVPLDPTYPKDRLAFMLKDAELSILLTQESLLTGLPEHEAQVLCLDRDRPRFDVELDTVLDVDSTPEDLAYAIFTSGSTGTPKAALLRHRSLCNVSNEQARAFGVGPGTRVLQFSSLSFDASTFDVVMALPKGGTLYLGDRDEIMPGPDLLGFLKRHEIEIVTLPPTALSNLPFESLTALRTITVAGEACPSDLVRRWAPGRKFFNLYGPTEATIWSTTAQLTAGDEPHIGKPIGNTRIYLLDAHLNPVPVGVPGEIHIGGVGLARGYFHRPQLTAERFIDNPFVAGERLYKTGDLGKRRPDGNIEFVGRIDHQVKLRGYRIELGEIEGALNQYPAVKQSVAMIREDVKGDRRLVAYVVHDPSEEVKSAANPGSPWESDHVTQWKTLYEESYGQASTPQDATFNISSWDSSYTSQPIPAAEMREWVDKTVEAILDTKPERVLELGCGMGLLLFGIAPHCKEYLGTDFSQAALNYVKGHIGSLTPGSAQVRLEQRAADDLTGIPEGHFDTIVLNSVAQYFPSIDYLARVLENAARVLRPGGRIFVGDVRSLPLLRAFHTSVQIHQAKGDLDVGRLRLRVHQQMNQDQELVISPEFFVALRDRVPRIRRVGIEPKRGRYDNELGRFRYDVLLSLDENAPSSPDRAEWLQWGADGLCLDEVRERLRTGRHSTLRVRAIPNRRVLRDVLTAEGLFREERPEASSKLDAAQDIPANAIDPDDLRDLCQGLPYSCAVTWAAGRADGAFDAVFQRRGEAHPSLDPRKRLDPLMANPETLTKRREWSEYANQPLRGRTMRELVPKLRQHAASRLPEYMVPSAFVVLDAFPVTPNGKVDRAKLPAPDSLRTELVSSFEAPRGKTEQILAEVWARTLNLDRVGIHDNFFELGGDSILCIHVVAGARDAGVHFAAKDLFQNPTVAALAKVARTAPVALPSEQGPVKGLVPLTPIQSWFFEQDLAEPHHFNQTLLFETELTFDPAHLRRALADVVKHHDALRSIFRRGTSGWMQEVGPPLDEIPFEVHELSSVPPAERRRRIEAEASRLQSSLNLSSGVLLTGALFHTAPSEPRALLLVVHHLAIDAISWSPLLQDLRRALEQLGAGGEARFSRKTSSYQSWAKGLTEYAQSPTVTQQASHWLQLPWKEFRALPCDRPSGVNTVGSTATVEGTLTGAQTHILLHDLPAAHGTEINSALLTALARALVPWTGQNTVLVDLEGHGREEVLEGIDISRTVGWFTSIHPVLLHVNPDTDAVDTLKIIHGQLTAIPGHGLAYGLARYLSKDLTLAAALRAQPRSEIAFNYLGQLDQAMGLDATFRIVDTRLGSSRGLRNRRAHALEVNGGVVGGKLRIVWTYSSNIHESRTIEGLAARFTAELATLIDSCSKARSAKRAGEPARNEFGWNAEDIDDLLTDIEKRG